MITAKISNSDSQIPTLKVNKNDIRITFLDAASMSSLLTLTRYLPTEIRYSPI